MSFNERIYSNLLDFFDVVNTHDRKLLANKLSSAWKTRSCCDNFRICQSNDDKIVTEEYKKLESNGCCGFFDEYIKNPITGNSYWIGFNYGH